DDDDVNWKTAGRHDGTSELRRRGRALHRRMLQPNTYVRPAPLARCDEVGERRRITAGDNRNVADESRDRTLAGCIKPALAVEFDLELLERQIQGALADGDDISDAQ